MREKTKTIGLVAGNGHFPILLARAAKRQGITVVAVGIRGDASWLLGPCVDRMTRVRVGEIRKGLDFFKSHGVREVIMAGQVSQRNLFDPSVQGDAVVKAFFDALNDRKADTIFSAVSDLLERHDLRVLDSTLLLRDFLAPQGTLTERGPSETELADIEFGKTIAKMIGGVDIGQTVVVKKKAIVAIEAMEGTDRCILRGGLIARQGAVVVKTSKPKQDARFDVPVVGPRTVQVMRRARCSCLGIEAGKTLILDQERLIRSANQAGICVVSS